VFRDTHAADREQAGVDESEVNVADQTLIPVLLGGLQQNAQDPEHETRIESAATNHAASGLLDSRRRRRSGG
jgi:hypothetical protein